MNLMETVVSATLTAAIIIGLSLQDETEKQMNQVHNVCDRRHDWIGSCDVSPLLYDKLQPNDVGRTVIYQDRGRAEAGTLLSWRDGLVFVYYSKGDTAAATKPDMLSFGRCDGIKREER
jgi:hypothetical protein